MEINPNDLINVGSQPNDETGDTLRNAFIKTNNLVTEINNSVNELYDLRSETIRVDTQNQKVAVFEGSSNSGTQIKIENTDSVDRATAYIDVRRNNIGIGGNDGWSSGNLNINTITDNIGIGERLPEAKLHIKGEDTILKLEGKNRVSNVGIEFSQGNEQRANIEYTITNNNLIIQSVNPSGNRSQITFKVVAGEGTDEEEVMRIQGYQGEGFGAEPKKQVVIGNPSYVNSSKELYVNGGILATEKSVFEGDVSIGGRCDADSYKLKGLNEAPPNSTSGGAVGDIRYTADYIYVCVQGGGVFGGEIVWKRVALSSF